MKSPQTFVGRRINPWGMFLSALVPNWLLRRSEVSQGAKVCYARLAQFAGADNKCHPRQKTLAAELGVGVRSVNDYLRELRRHGLLEWERPGLGKANRYYFLDHQWIHEGPALRAGSDSISQKTSGQERQSSSVPINEESQGKESKRKGTQTPVSLPFSLPSSEDEAVKCAASVGVPPDFARTVFNHMESVGWLDGSGRLIRKWEPYLKSRWSRDQSEHARRVARPRGGQRTEPASSLKTVRPEQFTGSVGKL